MSYLIINRDSICNNIQNTISIINKSNCENINYSDLYPIINYIWYNICSTRFEKELTALIHNHKPEINDAIILINNIVRIHNDNSWNNAAFLLCEYLNSQNKIIDNIKCKHSVSPVFCLKSGTLIFAKKKQLCGILKPLKQFTHVTGWEI